MASEIEVEEEKFKQFDIVTDYSDHFYANNSINGVGVTFTNPQNNVSKSIMKEWRNLERNLPDSIYVRVYEGRMDLLRAVIIGADGTPYHDGLFFFDVLFPTSYPNQPPLFHHRAHGMQLNPNLYPDGKICLSLLNTWFGSKSKGESWDPSRSTILQVLLSIQALVLNKKPYSNNPFTFVSSHVRRLSRQYNKQVFILSCKTMLCLWRRPPKNFEGFVKDHFRGRANKILKACKDYGDGNAIIGEEMNGNSVVVPEEWKTVMRDVHALLDAAFNKNEDVGPNKLPSVISTAANIEFFIFMSFILLISVLFVVGVFIR
ncbi:probable ubiquitin-conjugating enzyme E2 25 [Mercurialis annua]|uniref:probable ubiquitin-conjugating enzyme E2 25 n=1 Tax=Mercurialis annua TaxID=3986 RepID=UPI0021602CC1|nr:probable ubiquitin-conjugating enzyme E2 25 [Mercurialis annua]